MKSEFGIVRSGKNDEMKFFIADTFTDSLARMTAQEQKAAKTTAFDLQMDPSAPGLSFHKLDRVQDKNFWSVRVNADIRLIVHKTAASLLLVYVDHHDNAYKWAERRKIERHPTTGAMQLVEVRERVEDIRVFDQRLASAPKKPKLFDNLRKFELMSFGVPEEWVDDVRGADEDTLFDVISHLPQEAQEALLRLAVGETPAAPQPAPADADPFAHPDAQRRFLVLSSIEELRRALDYPWEKWAVFLHPDQRQLVTKSYAGPARISGSAGTGKTIVALHRAVHLARAHPEARVLLTTFSAPLANALKSRLAYLTANEPEVAARITTQAIDAVGLDLYARAFGAPRIVSADDIQDFIAEAAAAVPGHKFAQRFLMGEWSDVVDARNLTNWEAYRDVSRLGRRTRVSGKQREVLWPIFERVRAGLAKQGLVTWPEIFGRLSADLGANGLKPFDFAVVDEAQDIGVPEARFLAALAGDKSDGLFFAGDLGQRIFQQPFSWKSLGIDVRGRSFTLKVNYRTSHQIRVHADRLLPGSVSDVDGNAESRNGTVSVFDGPAPEVRAFDTVEAEQRAVAAWIMQRGAEGYAPQEIGVIVRSPAQLERAREAICLAGAEVEEMGEDRQVRAGVALGAMHLAKGLEFRGVAVMACDDDVLPLQERIEAVADDADLQEVYDTERHLLYVACTRARDRLFVTGLSPTSEFVDDFLKS